MDVVRQLAAAVIDAWIWVCLLAAALGLLRWGFGRRQ